MIDPTFGLCASCDAPLLQPHGFYGTDLCGPCCVGEAAAAGFVTWECVQRYNTGCNAADELLPGEFPTSCHLCGCAMERSGKARPIVLAERAKPIDNPAVLASSPPPPIT